MSQSSALFTRLSILLILSFLYLPLCIFLSNVRSHLRDYHINNVIITSEPIENSLISIPFTEKVENLDISCKISMREVKRKSYVEYSKIFNLTDN